MTTKQEKARRMEIRKKTGYRVITPPAVPDHRKGGYLVAHACFDCRVSFKVEPRDGFAPCPNCGKPLAPMGRSFKAPKKSNIMQWKKVEKLWLAGIRFPTIWGGVYRPKRWQDVDDFLKHRRVSALKGVLRYRNEVQKFLKHERAKNRKKKKLKRSQS